MAELYDALYRLGYHINASSMHYADVLVALRPFVRTGTVRTVLDVGCSSGAGVHALWRMGLRASGVDVSETAVQQAHARFGAPPERCVGRCWTAAPATRLPFADGAFDAVLSTDVLEHLDDEDVDLVAHELARVAKQWMFLKISNRTEHERMERTGIPSDRTRTFAAAAAEEFNVTVPTHLHTAVHHPEWWTTRFAAVGFGYNATIRTPPRACCAFALQRKALSAPAAAAAARQPEVPSDIDFGSLPRGAPLVESGYVLQHPTCAQPTEQRSPTQT